MSKPNFKIGDWVLHKTEYGKVWKLCEIKNRYNCSKTGRWQYELKNLKSKTDWISFVTQGNPIMIPIEKNSNIKDMSMKSLITLYGRPEDKNLNKWKFFKESTRFNVQINSKNKSLMKKILNLIEKEEGIILKEEKSLNVNIDKKYVLKENK